MDVLISGRERLRLMTINLIDMLKARGYDMSSEEERYREFSSANAHIVELDDNKYFRLEGTAVHPRLHKKIGYTLVGSTKAVYTTGKSIAGILTGWKFLRRKETPDKRVGVDDLVIIIDKPIQDNALRDHVTSQIQVFQINDLLRNITKHVLVPQHRILTKVEKEVFLSLTGIKDSQLPGAHINDPVIRYYGGKMGDLVYIQRFEIKNAGVVRSRPYIRIVKYIPEDTKHTTRSPATRRYAEYYKPSGRDVEEVKTMRRGNIRRFRQIPNVLPSGS